MAECTVLKKMGERIYRRRRALNLTQEQLAEKLGVSTQMISNLESGKKAIRPENLIKVCSVLDISADYILTGGNNDSFSRLSDKLNGLTQEELVLLESIVDYMNCK